MTIKKLKAELAKTRKELLNARIKILLLSAENRYLGGPERPNKGEIMRPYSPQDKKIRTRRKHEDAW
jgi:hypothetical protein